MSTSTESTDIPILLIYDLDRKHWGQFEIQHTLDKINSLTQGLNDLGHPLTVVPVYDTNLAELLQPYSPKDYILFNLCEELPGIPHSAGKVGEVIESLGFFHTGPSAQVLTFSQDKINVKNVLEAHNIPTPGWRVYASTSENGWHRFPAIVKPPLEHCSIGIDTQAVVEDHDELTHRIEYVLHTFNQPALVEDFIDGREFRISVIGNGGEARLLPPTEMDYSRMERVSERLLSYDSKMNPLSKYFNEIKLNCNPVFTAEEYRLLETIALKVFNVLDCHDYAGFDFRLRDGIFYVLDVNPDPEFSPESSLVLGAKKMGLSYGQLGSFVVNQAARRHPNFLLPHKQS
jgi:D-alanine-D-alanine ligase